MSDKGRLVIRILAGGYLVYLGIRLTRDVLSDRPDNYVFLALAGVAFVVLGGIWFVRGLLNYLRYEKAYRDDDSIQIAGKIENEDTQTDTDMLESEDKTEDEDAPESEDKTEDENAPESETGESYANDVDAGKEE